MGRRIHEPSDEPLSPLLRKRYGKSFSDLVPFRKKRSNWGVDEAGTASYTRGSSSNLTLVAVTLFGDVDYGKLVEGIELHDGCEIKFSTIRNKSPDQAYVLTKRFGDCDVLLLCSPHRKDPGVNVTSEEFYRSICEELVDAIKSIDRSNSIQIVFDDNSYLAPEHYMLMSDRRTWVHPGDSKGYVLIQFADIGAGALQHGMLPQDKGSTRYFENYEGRSVNMSEGSDMSTQPISHRLTSDVHTSNRGYKGVSKWPGKYTHPDSHVTNTGLEEAPREPIGSWFLRKAGLNRPIARRRMAKKDRTSGKKYNQKGRRRYGTRCIHRA